MRKKLTEDQNKFAKGICRKIEDEKRLFAMFCNDPVAQSFNTDEEFLNRLRRFRERVPEPNANDDDLMDEYNIAIGWWLTEDSTPEEQVMAHKLAAARVEHLGLKAILPPKKRR